MMSPEPVDGGPREHHQDCGYKEVAFNLPLQIPQRVTKASTYRVRAAITIVLSICAIEIAVQQIVRTPIR